MIHPGENIHVVCDREDCGESLDLSRVWVSHADTLGEAIAYAENVGWTRTERPVRFLCPTHQGASRRELVRGGV
jgi:hypothetical protein